MEIQQLLGDLPAALIPVVLVLYFFNQSNLRWMQERKEIIDGLIAERKEWIATLNAERREWLETQSTERREWAAWQSGIIERLFAALEKSTVAEETVATDVHQLRTRVQEFISKVELGFANIIALLTKPSRSSRGSQQ